MKTAIKFFVSIIFGLVMGWFLGFLRLPYMEQNRSFLLGFIACLLLVLLAVLLMVAWNKHAGLLHLFRQKLPAGEGNKATTMYQVTWILVAVFIIAGGLLSSFLIYRQSRDFKAQLQRQDKKLQEQSAIIESVRKGNAVYLMSNVLLDAANEMKQSGTLSEAVMARIAALSYSMKPYQYLQGDSLTPKALSPERGQLLMALLLMQMDTGSFAKIKRSTSFANADLSGANLKAADLSGVDLNGADLQNADLSHANLSHAGLKAANLWGANLNRANLSYADLKRANLAWARLNEADLTFSVMDGAQLSNAQLIKADSREASVQYAELTAALLNEASLKGVHFNGAGMRSVNLSHADMVLADLRMADLNEATLLGTTLNKALVDSNWTVKVSAWRITGAKEIREGYHVVTDSLDQWGHDVYHLIKTENSVAIPSK